MKALVKKQAKEGMSRLLFDWFACPVGAFLSDEGEVTLPLDTAGRPSEFWYTVYSHNLAFQEGTSSGEKKLQALKASQYYEVKLKVHKDGARSPLMDFETVVFQSKGSS